jgi:hypothetical protein
VSEAWANHYGSSRHKFEQLFNILGNLHILTISDELLVEVYRMGLGDALRYLAGPPISEDDLRVIAGVESLAPGVLNKYPEIARKVFEVIVRVIDTYRFPWLKTGNQPTASQLESALLASSLLLASQRIATERRNDGKESQESRVKSYLANHGFEEVSPESINTIVKGPQAMQFCAECRLGERKADVVVRLHDTRLMAIECKVSNSATNSVKRLNNDAAVKAEYWLKQFGTAQVVPAAVLAGVFNVLNLEQAQERGLALLWSHDLEKLGEFIDLTK